MNTQMAYLIGMILGNGEVHKNNDTTTISIEIPHKNLMDDEGREVSIYVKSSLVDIRNIIEPLIGYKLPISENKRATSFSFTMQNEEYTMREILRFIGDPTKRIKEDPLRILRAKRFIVEYDLTPERETLKALKENKDLISTIKEGKIIEEKRKFDKISKGKNYEF